MATITAAAGGGVWSAGGSWVGGVAPTAADDARLASTSGNLTVDATGALCRSLDCTGYTGTLLFTGSGPILRIGDAGGGALKLVAGMTLTLGTVTAALWFNATSGPYSVTTAGKTLPGTSFGAEAAGGSWQLQDDVTTQAQFLVERATLTTNDHTVTCREFTVSAVAGVAATVNLGASAINCTGVGVGNVSLVLTAPLTFGSNTATITTAGAGPPVVRVTGAVDGNGVSLNLTGAGTQTIDAPSGLTLKHLTRTGTAVPTDALLINGSVTVTGTLTLTGSSVMNRLRVQGQSGTTASVSAAAVALTNCDFDYLTASGVAAPWTGTSICAYGHTSGISPKVGTVNPPVKNTAFSTRIALNDLATAGAFRVGPTLVAGDFKVDIDGAGFMDLSLGATVNPTGTSSVRVTLTPTEMNGNVITLLAADQTTPKEWADFFLCLVTRSP